MPPDRRRADHLKSQFRVVDGIRPGAQLAGIPALGILVSGDMRRPRGHRERTDLGRPRRGRQHQPRRLGHLLARDSGTQPDLHHRASGKRVRQLRRKDSSHISRAGPRIEQAPVAFSCLLLALGLRADRDLMGIGAGLIPELLHIHHDNAPMHRVR
jgi:hypothetical protein